MRMQFVKYYCLIFISVMIGNLVIAQTNAKPIYKNSKASIELRIKDLLSRMTLEDKCRQLDVWHPKMNLSKPDTLQKAIADLGDTVKNGVSG
jgi:beta-glucosidase